MLDLLHSLQAWLREHKWMTTWIWIVVLFVVLGIGTLMGLPFSRPENSSGSQVPAFGSTGQLVSVFLKWMAVIGLMYVAFIFLRRWQPGGGSPQIKQLAIIERLGLSQRQALVIVRVGDRKLLLGATDQNISLITEIESNDELATETKPEETGKEFNSLLQKKLKGNDLDLFSGKTGKNN